MERTGIVFLVDTDTSRVVHTVFEALLNEQYIKTLETHYSNFFGKNLFAEIYVASEVELPS